MPHLRLFLTVRRIVLTTTLCLCGCGLAVSAPVAGEDSRGQDPFALPLEELLNIQVAIATLEPIAIHAAPSIITQISHEEIQHLNPRTISDLLSLTPGFNVVVESLHAPLLQFRGTGNRQDNVLLLIDGHRLNSQLFGGGTYVINDIPVELIDHIEIIRGPGSAIYGSNAFEAVINLVTVPAQTNRQGLLYGKYGTNETVNGGLTYKDKTPDRHLVLAASGYDSNGPNDPYVDLSAYPGTVEFPQTTRHLYATGRQGNWSILALRNVEKSGPFIGNAQFLNTGTDRKYTTTAVEAGYSTDLNDYGNITLKTYYDEFDYDCLWEPWPARIMPPTGIFKDATATDSRLGGELLWKKTLFSNHRFLVGSSYDFLKLSNSSMQLSSPATAGQMVPLADSWIKPEKNYHASLFLQDQFPLFTASHLTLGTRYDNYDNYGDTLNPRIGFTTPVSTDSQVKLLYGTAFRAPSYYESNTTANGGLTPNPDIRPERLSSVEAEYSMQLPGLSWHANTFYSRIKDLIETAHTVDGRNMKINIGVINTCGLEAGINRNLFSNRHTIGLNGFWNHAEDDTGKHVTSVPHYGAVMLVNNAWSAMWNTNFQLKYTGKMDKDSLVDDNGTLLAPAHDLEATITSNFSVACTLGAVTIRGAVYNMFDEPLYSPASVRLNSAGDMLADYPYQGRFAMLSLEYVF